MTFQEGGKRGETTEHQTVEDYATLWFQLRFPYSKLSGLHQMLISIYNSLKVSRHLMICLVPPLELYTEIQRFNNKLRQTNQFNSVVRKGTGNRSMEQSMQVYKEESLLIQIHSSDSN